MSASALLSPPPVAGGLDVDLPGAGVRLRGTRWPGAGVPVLLLHGLASTRRFWDPVASRLAGLPVLALDQRGHGDSEAAYDGRYDGAAVTADALAAMDAVGLSRAVVVGHSWGASTALRLAAEHPGRVLALVAVDGALASPRSAGATRAEARVALTPPRRAVAPEELRGLLAQGPLGRWWSAEVERALLPLFALHEDGLVRPRLAFEHHMAIVDDLLDTDLAALWARVDCPAWAAVAEGEADRPGRWEDERRRAAEDLARSGVRVLRWAGAVHDVPLQWPALVAGLVRAAADEVASPGAGGEGPRS